MRDEGVSVTMTIVNKRGLHARAAAKFVTAASRFASDIKVVRDDVEAAGTSILGLMMLGAGPGQEIVIMATGADARDALDALAALVTRGFDES